MSSPNPSLKKYNTLGLNVAAREIIVAATPEALTQAWQNCQQRAEPFLLLGEGSNVLFLEDFSGTVVINNIQGIKIKDRHEAWHLHAGAGENWHELVRFTLGKGMPGLENLALIPGKAGSAPIQNIGAYGVEFKDKCDYVDVLELTTGQPLRLSRDECQFGYRDSIFKHQYQQGYAITGVGLKLAKQWKSVLTYGDSARLNPATASGWDIFECVCAMRRSKLPDPQLTGNAGSFFKNPLISAQQAEDLLSRYPQMPVYPQQNGDFKLAAGWLIEQCQLKGYQAGGAAVHQQQALVLINANQATPDDIVILARHIRAEVGKKFSVWLEPEVRFIGAEGERNATEVIA